MRLILAALAAALLTVPAAAQTAPAAAPADQEARLRAIGERGRLLFDLDRAAWVATDDMMKKIRDPARAGVKGYVVERDGRGFLVTFFGGDLPVAMYVARVAGGRVESGRLLSDAERVALTPLQTRLAAARSAAAASGLQPCTPGGFNAAVIPPDTLEAPIELYLTSPQTQADVLPFGGHFLLTIAADGRIQSVRKFTTACLNMEKPRGGGRRGQPVALLVTHLLDPVPTEIHVFMSLSAGMPLFVGAGDPPQLWAVEGDKIRSAGPIGAPPRRR
jgi:hypothetical protein